MLLEIISPAVIGRSEERVSWSHQVAAPGLKQVLGVRVGKALITFSKTDGKPQVELTVDADLWCAGESGTRVLHTRCRTHHPITIKTTRPLLGEERYQVELVGNPRSTGVRMEGEALHVNFEAVLSAELTALTRFWVKACDEPPIFSGASWDASRSDSGSH